MKHSIAVRDKDSAAASAKALQKRLDEVQSHDAGWKKHSKNVQGRVRRGSMIEKDVLFVCSTIQVLFLT